LGLLEIIPGKWEFDEEEGSERKEQFTRVIPKGDGSPSVRQYQSSY